LGLEISNSVMAVTAASHGAAYGHRIRTEWRLAMTRVMTTNTDRELTQTELRDDELAIVSGGTKSGGTAGGTVAAGWDIKANKRV
jgi:hypothetical protein